MIQRLLLNGGAHIAWLLILLWYAWAAFWLHIAVDGGVYMYVGQVIAHGGVPYADTWDHKGPLLYLFNAAGIALGLGSIRGVYLLEALLVASALLLCVRHWTHLAGRAVAAVTAIAFALSYISILQDVNLTETWLAPFALVSYTLIARYLSESKAETAARAPPLLVPLILGVSGAVAALTRVNNGFGLFIAALLLIVLSGRFWRFTASGVAAGFAAVILPIAVWALARGFADDLLAQYVDFNLAYSKAGSPDDRYTGALYLLKLVATSAAWALVLLAAGYRFAVAREAALSAHHRGALFFLLIAGADLGSQLISGHGFSHYAVMPLPALAVAAVLFLSKEAMDGRPAQTATSPGIFFLLVLAAAFAPSAVETLRAFRWAQVSGAENASSPLGQLTAYVRSHTRPEDSILLLGQDTAVLAASGRRSATTMSYMSPLSIAPPVDGLSPVQRYSSEAAAAKPRLIIRAQNTCPIAGACKPGMAGYNLKPLRDWSAREYRLSDVIEGREIWQRLDAPAASGGDGRTHR